MADGEAILRVLAGITEGLSKGQQIRQQRQAEMRDLERRERDIELKNLLTEAKIEDIGIRRDERAEAQDTRLRIAKASEARAKERESRAKKKEERIEENQSITRRQQAEKNIAQFNKDVLKIEESLTRDQIVLGNLKSRLDRGASLSDTQQTLLNATKAKVVSKFQTIDDTKSSIVRERLNEFDLTNKGSLKGQPKQTRNRIQAELLLYSSNDIEQIKQTINNAFSPDDLSVEQIREIQELLRERQSELDKRNALLN